MNINKSEVLRYLGYKNQFIDNDLNKKIDNCIEDMKTIAKPLFTYSIFDIEVLEEEVKLLGYEVSFKGKDIVKHLKDSTRCVVLAVTIGIEAENRIRYFNKVDTTAGIIMDSSATEAVESLCSLAEEEIKKEAESQGVDINYRYSPGYGDFSIEIQPEILKLLNAEKNIGLTCTEDFILLPRKSVTAVIGFISKGEKIEGNKCSSCNVYKNCLYRRDGMSCEF